MANLGLWKPIPGFEGLYEVSDQGIVRSYKNGKWGFRLEPRPVSGQKGKHYKTIPLCKDGKKYTKLVHRLVAEAFVPNPDGLPCVNHKDGNKLNNRADNLEWCTHAENMHHAKITGLFSGKQIVCVDDGAVYVSVTDAAAKTGISRRSISNCLCGRSKTAGKRHWGYVT